MNVEEKGKEVKAIVENMIKEEQTKVICPIIDVSEVKLNKQKKS